MFINKLNQLYKPKRLLFYKEADESEIAAFYEGTVPPELAGHSGAFGTYDYPGVFFISSLDKEVIGMEYRIDDDRIDYPEGLSCVTLEEAYFYSIEIAREILLDIVSIRSLFEKIAQDDDAHRGYSDLSIKADPGVVAVFTSGKKIRILYEWKIDHDRSLSVMRDDADGLEHEYLYRMSFFDPITGHYNWNHLVPYLEMPADAGIRDYAFAHFDIKSFRTINEVYGHIAANKVLSNVVKAMNEADFVYASARCHNDNFAMMIRDMPREEMISTLKEFFDKLSVLEEDPNYKICYRCGLVPMQRSVLSGNRVADAGKLAQALGTNPGQTEIIVYTDKMHDDILWGNFIKAYLDTAIENDEFEVYLQPKFDIAKETIKGAEALIRWQYKKQEFLSPGRFIPFFERDGSIGKVDDIVLEKVCRAFSKWQQEGRPLYPVSVNLSRSRLYDPTLTDHLTQIVDKYQVPHELIDFELTESASYDDMDHLITVLESLRQKGFRISMDDFGTGYSSLSLLTQMPLDTLKIDKSFVDKVGTGNERQEDIVVLRHIIDLAKELHFTCLAEGAEEKCQVDRLKGLGCEVIQGYYFSRPVPITEYEKRYVMV